VITLAIVRHADAAWGSPSLPDHERPLSARGHREAVGMAHLLREQGFRPGRLISSTALRARQTAAVFADELGIALEQDDRLYGAGPETLRNVAEQSGAGSVLLVAHDPGLSVLAHSLTDTISAMPTCAVARFTWDAGSWPETLAEPLASWTFDTPR
jgi:phosphohistidine phosphatase